MTDLSEGPNVSFERQHAEVVAERWLARCTPSQGEQLCTLADLIAQERAGLLARAEAAERDVAAWKHATVCETTAEACADYDELEATVADLRAKLAAAEARVVELQSESRFLARDVAATHEANEQVRADLQKAEAAAGQMRCLLERCLGVLAEGETVLIDDVDAALATDAGRDYMSPEQVAKACAAARDAALEEAEKVTNGGLLDNDDTVSMVLRLACKRIHALKAGTP